jgi:hypothetical protein
MERVEDLDQHRSKDARAREEKEWGQEVVREYLRTFPKFKNIQRVWSVGVAGVTKGGRLGTSAPHGYIDFNGSSVCLVQRMD